MKIAFILNSGYSLFHPEYSETYGGAQIDQYLLGKALRKKGYEISFVFHDYGQLAEERLNDGIMLYKSYPPKNSQFLPFQFFRAAKRIYQTLRKINTDICFIEGANFELFVVALYCRFYKKKLIYRLASDIEADGRYEKENYFQGWLYKMGRNLSTIVITQTDKQYKLLKQRKIESQVITNAYYIQHSKGNLNGPILWVGRLICLKRPEIFLDIAELFPDEKFVLIGQMESIDQIYAASIIERIKKIKNIRYIPKVDFSEIDRFFQQSSVLINTSTYEGFPMTFLQAMSFGVPIISFGVNPDNILGEIGGSCVSSIKQAVQSIKYYRETNAWETTSKLSQNYFCANFSLDLVIAQYETLFKENK